MFHAEKWVSYGHMALRKLVLNPVKIPFPDHIAKHLVSSRNSISRLHESMYKHRETTCKIIKSVKLLLRVNKFI
jgi:hypothetical protein